MCKSINLHKIKILYWARFVALDTNGVTMGMAADSSDRTSLKGAPTKGEKVILNMRASWPEKVTLRYVSVSYYRIIYQCITSHFTTVSHKNVHYVSLYFGL